MIITIDPVTNQTYYFTQVNPAYFDNQCNMMAFIVLESLLACGEEELTKYIIRYTPADTLAPSIPRKTY